MPIGGSITQGVGSSDYNGYRKFLYDMLQSKGHDVQMVGSRHHKSWPHHYHEGWRGFRIDQIDAKAKASVGKLLPNLFTVNAGSNDCLQEYRLDEVGQRMEAMLEYLWTASPGSTVILSNLLVNRDPTTSLRLNMVNEQLRSLANRKAQAERRIIFADMCSSHGPCRDDLIEDDTHPNDEGYKKMAAIWLHGIEQAVERGFILKK